MTTQMIIFLILSASSIGFCSAGVVVAAIGPWNYEAHPRLINRLAILIGICCAIGWMMFLTKDLGG